MERKGPGTAGGCHTSFCIWCQSLSCLCRGYFWLPHSMAASGQSDCLHGSLELQATRTWAFITYPQKLYNISSAIVTSCSSRQEGVDTASQWEECHSHIIRSVMRGRYHCTFLQKCNLPQMAKGKISDLILGVFWPIKRIHTVLSFGSFSQLLPSSISTYNKNCYKTK